MSISSRASRAFVHGGKLASRTTSRIIVPRNWQFQASRACVLHPRIQTSLPLGLRCLHTVPARRAGLMPDTPDPQPPETEEAHVETHPTEVSEEEYHQLADTYMESVYEQAEKVQESRQDVEVEFSSGVLSITFPPNGTYVINKQPPNKQIWLSSPISGPKRYDWVLADESMDHKEGSGRGEWIYLRDNSTLSDVLGKELGLIVGPHEESMEVSKDPIE